ncbi:MAG: hypothetical protein Q8S18_05960 [Bacteroidales bacterium]|nr:hypothetical protein [Bacteroidales bacterium]
MSKVIDSTSNNWYQEVAPRDFYLETDLERIIMHNLPLIFPEYIPVLFKDDLIHRVTGKTNRADLCMIKSDYSQWYVIEVELGKHTKNDVVNQIDTFRNCNYTDDNANYIHKRKKSLNLSKLTSLIKGTPPELMVIVNEVKNDWKSALSSLNCKMCVFQIYNDFDGRQMYRLEGEHPFIYTNFRNCKYEKELPYAVKILREEGFLDSLNINDGMQINIEYNGVKHTWERQDAGNDVFLICNSKMSPLDSLSSRYRLNYYKTGWIKQPIGNFFQILFGKYLKRPKFQINNSFSFTKD